MFGNTTVFTKQTHFYRIKSRGEMIVGYLESTIAVVNTEVAEKGIIEKIATQEISLWFSVSKANLSRCNANYMPICS